MKDVITAFNQLVMPLKQLGFSSNQVLLPVVQVLTQHTSLAEEAKLMLSAILAGDLQVEEDFDS